MSVKCLSVCVCVRAKGLEWVDVCLLSEEVCNSVWQWVINSESQSQTLLRKHKACMPGHIPVCLSIRLCGLFVDQYDSPEQKDYNWIVSRHQHLSCYTLPTSHSLDHFCKLYQTSLENTISHFFHQAQLFCNVRGHSCGRLLCNMNSVLLLFTHGSLQWDKINYCNLHSPKILSHIIINRCPVW